MFLRSAALVCAAALLVSMKAPAIADTPAAPSMRCEEATFRVYFDHNSAALSPFAMQTLDVAARNVAACSYAELHVSVDTTSRYAAQRGHAIVDAMNSRTWNVAAIAPQTSTHLAAYSTGPEFAEVMVTPQMIPANAAPTPAARPGV